MHHQEIFQVIVNNYAYEYLVIDKKFQVIEHSEKVVDYLNNVNFSEVESIFDCMPELIGMEAELEAIFAGELSDFVLENIFKEPDAYIHLHFHPGKKGMGSEKGYETLLLLVEDVTDKVAIERKIHQDHNDKALLLDDIALKNKQLNRFNEQMQELVAIEIEKNVEKQKLLELQSRHAQMGEMIGMITHQWKQPLNTLSMMINGFQLKYELDRLDGDTIETFMQKLQDQIFHMNQTVSDFQHFFNPTKGKVVFNLKSTIDSVLNLISYEYEMQEITLVIEGDTSVDAYGFPNEYTQVVLSILKNAKDAFLENLHDEMKVVISIEEEQTGRSLLTIRDNAGGIPESKIDTVFERYMTTKEEGSGLGLNIAKHIIEHNMNGKLSVCNVAQGAKFSLFV